ncbi:hypothetical protein SSPIM334S_05275 [Streptomyces spiroverticillatus]
MAIEPGRRPLRASDADREEVVEQLREAAAEGRLDMEELDERLGLALSAKTVDQLPSASTGTGRSATNAACSSSS